MATTSIIEHKLSRLFRHNVWVMNERLVRSGLVVEQTKDLRHTHLSNGNNLKIASHAHIKCVCIIIYKYTTLCIYFDI